MRIDQVPGRASSRWTARWMAPTPRQCLTAALVFFLALVAIGTVPGYAQALSRASDDRLLHFLAYALLSGLIFKGLPGIVLGRAIGSLLTIALLGAADEAIQFFMSYRSASLDDWYIDMLAALACVAVLILHERKNRMGAAQTRKALQR